MLDQPLILMVAAVAMIALMAYAVLGGADFGGGVWDLFATGPRKAAQREAIAHAMGPVWEANHVWLIFVLVLLFTCFPYGYSGLVTAMFIPFHLALLGIMLRGASFVFRAYRRGAGGGQLEGGTRRPVWGMVFGVASVITPFLLGSVFGALTAGQVRIIDGEVVLAQPLPWLMPYAIGCGLLGLSTCAYLAAVYLMAETRGTLREDFRRRGIIAGTSTAALAAIVLVLAWFEARWFFEQLISMRTWPIIAVGLLLFAASAWAVFGRRYRPARVFAAGEVVVLLLGWAVAHQPYLVYPDLKLTETSAPETTLRFVLWSLPFGAAILAPSLWLLFSVFKSEAALRSDDERAVRH